jgi:hypothetical protein
MAKDNTRLVWGGFFVFVGIVLLIGNFTDLYMGELWPVLVIAGGLAFVLGYFLNRDNYGLLMPGALLVVNGLLFLTCSLDGWYHMESLWPVFILAPALGFLAMYCGGVRETGLLIPAGILFVIGLSFLFVSLDVGEFWPILLILVGVLLIVLDFTRRRETQARPRPKSK